MGVGSSTRQHWGDAKLMSAEYADRSALHIDLCATTYAEDWGKAIACPAACPRCPPWMAESAIYVSVATNHSPAMGSDFGGPCSQ
jgi:hypothetical protein